MALHIEKAIWSHRPGLARDSQKERLGWACHTFIWQVWLQLPGSETGRQTSPGMGEDHPGDWQPALQLETPSALELTQLLSVSLLQGFFLCFVSVVVSKWMVTL